jgi:hypothetical protein
MDTGRRQFLARRRWGEDEDVGVEPLRREIGVVADNQRALDLHGPVAEGFVGLIDERIPHDDVERHFHQRQRNQKEDRVA